MKLRLLALAVAAALAAGCGGEASEGTATLWVTRDRGKIVLVETRVRAGLTAMQALKRKAEVDTRYGGRFVHAINGIEGSPATQRDWFYFVNGYELDRGAAEYTLHAGDVLWWDYRSWRRELRVPVVVGAFPEPFLHGFDGERRETVVRYALPQLEGGARAVAKVLGAASVEPMAVAVPKGANAFLITDERPFRLHDVSDEFDFEKPGDPVVFAFAGDGRQLARNPRLVRFRYEVP